MPDSLPATSIATHPAGAPAELYVVSPSGTRYLLRLGVLRAEIHRRHDQEGANYLEIAADAGCERTTIYRLLRGPVSMAMAATIAKGLHVDPGRVILPVINGDPWNPVEEVALVAAENRAVETARESLRERGGGPLERFVSRLMTVPGPPPPFNRKLAPILLGVSLFTTLISAVWAWFTPTPGVFSLCSLALFLVSFFTVRMRWTLIGVGAVFVTRAGLVAAGKMTLETAIVEVAFASVYCLVIRGLGWFTRFFGGREVEVAMGVMEDAQVTTELVEPREAAERG